MQIGREDSTAEYSAVDELGDAVVSLVRTWRSLGRRAPEGSQSTIAVLELARLLGDTEHRVSTIAERRGVDQSVISRQIADLEHRGLVCRRPDPSDRRACLVRLTPAGREVLEHATALRQKWLQGALERCPVGDVRTTAHLMAALADELQARASELGPLAEPPPPRRHPHTDEPTARRTKGTPS